MSLKIGTAVAVGEFWYIRNKGGSGLYVGKVLSIDGHVIKVQTSTYTSHVKFIEADVDAIFVQKREAQSYD
jgi:hypothetical protein